MSTVNKDGILIDNKVILRRFPSIEHGSLSGVHAIVVHQTDAPTAQHTFNGYNAGGNGAHFLIEKNGQIYQTASVNKRCYHVGRLIKSKCLTINQQSCNSANMAKILAMSWTRQIKALDANERAKSYPHRYPVNSDSIGIELVGKHIDKKRYETVTPSQNASLQWLVGELYTHFSLTSSDVYKHPEVSYKHPGEAGTATWK
jgi:N-acetyl-anhydromuramyl-L-alanine amidase AmpD